MRGQGHQNGQVFRGEEVVVYKRVIRPVVGTCFRVGTPHPKRLCVRGSRIREWLAKCILPIIHPGTSCELLRAFALTTHNKVFSRRCEISLSADYPFNAFFEQDAVHIHRHGT